MAAALPVFLFTAAAGTAVSAIGSLAQGVQGAQAAEAAGESQAQAAEANSRIAEQQAATIREQAAQERRRAVIEAEIFQREARRRRGTAIASIAASGIQISGSAINVLHDIALSDEQQRLFILTEGEQRAQARLAGATIEEMSAAEFTRQAAAERDVGRFAAGASRTAGLFGAAGTILTGATQIGLAASLSPSFRRAGGGLRRVGPSRVTPIPRTGF